MVFDPEFESILRERAKAQIRIRMRALRNSIPEGARAARSRKIVDGLLSTDVFKGAHSIGMFWPMLAKNEVDLRPLDEASRDRQKLVFYPSIDAASGQMTLREGGPASLEERGRGFLEPPADAKEPVFDEGLLVMVPALAIDANGHRLGYGFGFYDRMLARISPPARTVGVAYDFQLLAEVPTTSTDMPVMMVLTDARILAMAAGT